MRSLAATRKWLAENPVPNIEGQRKGIPPWVALFANRSSAELLLDRDGAEKQGYYLEGELFLKEMANSLSKKKKAIWVLHEQGLTDDAIQSLLGYKHRFNIRRHMAVMYIWELHIRKALGAPSIARALNIRTKEPVRLALVRLQKQMADFIRIRHEAEYFTMQAYEDNATDSELIASMFETLSRQRLWFTHS